MRATRSIRARRARHKIQTVFKLQITALIDVMVILLVFLLKSATVSSVQFSTVPGIELPLSLSKDIPPEALLLIVTPSAMTFENQRILDFTASADSLGSNAPTYQFRDDDLKEGGKLIVPLFQALLTARDKSELLSAKSQYRDEAGKPAQFFGELAVQADKRIQYDTLRKIMYTAAAAGYRIFHFLAIKKEEY